MTPKENTAGNVGVILLAAGGSKRLGHPKQLLDIQGVPLFRHSLNAALATGAPMVVVVLGANAEAIRKEVTSEDVHVVYNAAWQEGMAASIRCGMAYLQQKAPLVETAILMVCDQPYVSATLLNHLIAAYKETSKPIVTCSYANTFGPPTLFEKTMFPELMQLSGDVGARSILKKHADRVVTIPFSKGVIDIDTEADYRKYLQE